MSTLINAPMDPLVISGEAEAVAEHLVIPRAEQAEVLVRPGSIGRLWVENEYDELELEQPDLWSAAGVSESRAQHTAAAQHRQAATEVAHIVSDHRSVVDDARQRLLHTCNALTAFRRRAKGTKRWYQAAKAGFLLGDVAGFGTAAIWLGEMPAIAIPLATSAAVATVAAGLLGVDVRDRELRRQRAHAVPDLSDAQRAFPHLFTAVAAGGTFKQMLMVAAATGGTVGVGIAALRSAVDDPFIGLIFGGIAMAVAGGSFLVSYAGADEVADVIEHAESDYARTISEHLRHSQHPVVAQFEGAKAEEDSILREHAARGAAAARRMRALKWGILRRNPSHAGHGVAPGRTAPIGGQTPRREETHA